MITADQPAGRGRAVARNILVGTVLAAAGAGVAVVAIWAAGRFGPGAGVIVAKTLFSKAAIKAVVVFLLAAGAAFFSWRASRHQSTPPADGEPTENPPS